MRPVEPIVPGHNLTVTRYAEHQKEYRPLPVHKLDSGRVLSRWKLSWRERLIVLFRGDVYLWVHTFNQPLQPVKLEVGKPQVVAA